jgi:hypothetical protein
LDRRRQSLETKLDQNHPLDSAKRQYYDAQQFASPVKKADRRSRRADFLMTERIVAPRLADIIEAIERIRRVLA